MGCVDRVFGRPNDTIRVQPGDFFPSGEDGDRDTGGVRLMNGCFGGGLELGFNSLAEIARERLHGLGANRPCGSWCARARRCDVGHTHSGNMACLCADCQRTLCGIHGGDGALWDCGGAGISARRTFGTGVSRGPTPLVRVGGGLSHQLEHIHLDWNRRLPCPRPPLCHCEKRLRRSNPPRCSGLLRRCASRNDRGALPVTSSSCLSSVSMSGFKCGSSFIPVSAIVIRLSTAQAT